MNVSQVSSANTVDSFVQTLLQSEVDSGFVVTDKSGNVSCSHPAVEDFKNELLDNYSFDKHEGVFFKVDKLNNCVFFVFVHSTIRGNSQGGTRMLSYNTLTELIEDGLRLSKAMTDKNAVAGLWWGGGKSIICPLNKHENFTLKKRKSVFQNFGKFVAKLKGVYVAAEDMNTTPEDMHNVLCVNRFVTCLPEVVGGSANPSPWTAKGVFNAMRAVVKYYEGKSSLKDKVVVVQGVGNVGKCLVKLLVKSGALVKVFDSNEIACREVEALTNVVVLPKNVNVYTEPCDIFAPCAIGGVINDKTISMLKAKYIVGAANNQLLKSEENSLSLAQKNIVYLPDFFINRMGIVNCADEQYGRLESDLLKAAQQVYADTLNLLSEAEKENSTPQRVAENLTEKLSSIPHPIWGHRGKVVIEDVISKW